MSSIFKFAKQSLIAIAIGLVVIGGILFVLDRRASKIMTPPSPAEGEPSLIAYCEAAGAGFQSGLMLNRVADGTLRYWMPDVDVQRFPSKAPNEFRIILVGGLGNQNGDTPRPRSFVLPRLIEQALSAPDELGGKTPKVYNFSAYATNIYQNYLALNLVGAFGGAIDADLIVAYVGFNDWVIPYYFERLPEAHCGYSRHVEAIMYLSRPWEFPPQLQWLASLFPNLMRRTPIGSIVKGLYDTDYFTERAREGYKQHRGIAWKDTRDMIDNHAIPFFINSLKSLKRDQSGAPVMVVWPGATADEIKAFDNPEAVLGKGFYRGMFERTRRELAGYLNKEWQFVDMNEVATAHSTQVSIEPDDHMQALIAKTVAQQIMSGKAKAGAAQ